MPDSHSPRVLIAGGGIGGLTAAVALRRRGIAAVVCEQAPELREVGAGLLLSPNAARVLTLLGLHANLSERSRLIREWRILDCDGRRLHRLWAEHDGVAALSLHRADLQFLLRAELDPHQVRLGFTVAGYEESQDGIALCAKEGQRAEGTVVVGADGLRSRIRALRFGPSPPRYCGYVGWRCVVPWQPKGYDGDWLSESWGEGKRFGITPLSGHRCYWYATANLPESACTAPISRRTQLLELFGHWHAPIPELIAATPEDTILLNPIFDRPPRADWTSGRVTLLGDAAHPMSPNLGQGACSAIEDGWVLASALADRAGADWPVALQEYHRARRLRSRAISFASRALGAVIQLESPEIVAVRDVVLRCTPEICSGALMRPLFAFRP